MKRALLLALLLAPATGVCAAERPHCMNLEKAQKAAGKDTAIVALSPAQFHFLQGLYVAMPSTPEGLPPGDGAVLLTRDRGEEGVILWTRGALACDPLPIGHAANLMKLLAGVKAGSAGDGDAL